MKTKITFLVLVFSFFYSFSQRKIADKFYKEYAYLKAAEFYKKAINKGDEDGVYLHTRLADCYYNNANSKQAAYWYSLAAQRKEGLSEESIYKYVQSLRSIGKYEKAEKWLKKMPKNNLSIVSVDHEKLLVLNKDSIRITNLKINTKNSDFGTFIHKDKFFFASAKNENGGDL